MSLLMYKVKDSQLVKCKDTELDPEYNYIIIDKHIKRPKIWVWRGPDSNIKDRYFVGVSATVIKNQELLYGSNIEIVEAGSEPEQFPKLEEASFQETSDEDYAALKDRLNIQPALSAQSELVNIKNALDEQVIPEELEAMADNDTMIQSVQEEVPEPTEKIEKTDVIDIPTKKGKKGSGRKPIAPVQESDVVLKQKLKLFLRDTSKVLQNIQEKIDKFLEEL